MGVMIGILSVLAAAPLLAGLAFYLNAGRGKRFSVRVPGGFAAPGAFGKSLRVEIYSFDGEVRSFDDVRAIRMGAYRDTGSFIGYSEDGPDFRRAFHANAPCAEEIAKILDCAGESVRVSDRETLYFFTSVKPLKLKCPEAQSVYQCISGRVRASRGILCRMDAIPAGEADDNGETADPDDNVV